jgi:hypothetical protein
VNAIKRSDAGTMFDESSFMYAHTGSFPSSSSSSSSGVPA